MIPIGEGSECHLSQACSKEASAWKLPEPSFFSNFLTIGAPGRNDKGVDLGFFPKKEGNHAYGSTLRSTVSALCKNHKGIGPSRYGKKMTKVTQVRRSRRLKGNVKFP